jgi:hypothetical protein
VDEAGIRPQPRHHDLRHGTEMNPVQLDTSTAATDTIAYVATDSQGLTATSTRTVIFESIALPAPASPSASSTEATTTEPHSSPHFLK